MLDVALVNFVGAGLASFAPVYGLKVPPGAMTNGTLLVQSLYQHDRSSTRGIVEATVKAIWQDWIKSGMPNSVAEAHLAQLPQILDENQPDPDILVGAYAVTNAAAKLTVTAIEAQSRRISTDIIENARTNDSTTSAGLSEAVIFFFLEALYRNLLPARQFVDDSKTVIENFLQERHWDPSDGAPAPNSASAPDEAEAAAVAPGSDTSPAPGEKEDRSATTPKRDNSEQETVAGEEPIEPIADSADFRATLVAAVRSTLAKRIGIEAAEKRDITKSIEIGLDLAANLAGCEDPDDEFRSYVRQAHKHLVAGALAEAQSALAVAENAKQNSARAEPESSQSHLRAAAQARDWRGRLQEMLFEFRGAARHYAAAARHLSDTDFERLWLYAERQILALVRLDEEFAEADALVEASKTCTSQVMVLLDERARSSQARAKLMLGQLLTTLGEREADPERFRLAGGHLKDAVSYFSKSGQKDLQGRAMLLRADAMAGLGAFKDDLQSLEEAVRAYQDLHSLPETLSTPAHANQISIKLGIALSNLGAAAKNDDIVDVATETLRSGIETLDNAEHGEGLEHNELIGRANAALARAIVAKSGISDNDEALAEAEAVYRLAIAALSGTRARIELKKLCDEHTALRRRRSPETALGEIVPSQGTDTDGPVPTQQTSGDLPEPTTGGDYRSRLRASLKLANEPADAVESENSLKSA